MGEADVQQVKPKILDIIYQDDHLVAINKPAHLACIPGRAEPECVVGLLAAQLGLPCKGEADPRLRVVHRLDKDTTGVLLFAKDIESQRALSNQFQNNLVRKEYMALVIGRPFEGQGEIDAPLMPDRAVVGKMAVNKRGKPAVTRWKLEQAFRGVSLMRAFPQTGKTHQIRVHLKHIGHPLAVDELYGPPVDERGAGLFLSQFKRGYRTGKDGSERPLIARLTLHAEKLTFTHPDGRSIQLTAPLPKDFRATLNMLGKYAVG